MKDHRRIRPPKGNVHYQDLWRIVDASVASTFDAHPEYVPKGISVKAMRNSVTKRVVGTVLSYAMSVVSR